MAEPALLAAIGAGLAIGLTGMGSSIGVGIAGASGAGVISERPEKFGPALVFQALPQTQAIYGLLIAILIMSGAGFFGGGINVDPIQAYGAFGASLSIGLAGLLSAIGQGITAAAGIASTARRPETMGKNMVFTVMAETFAIFGLLGAVLILLGSGML